MPGVFTEDETCAPMDEYRVEPTHGSTLNMRTHYRLLTTKLTTLERSNYTGQARCIWYHVDARSTHHTYALTYPSGTKNAAQWK